MDAVALKLGCEKQLLRSRPMNGIVLATDASRLLEWPAVGSVVLLWKLLGWAHADSKQAGGLGSDQCSEAVSAFLHCVLVVAGQGLWKLVLFYDALDVSEAAWPWKRYWGQHVLLPIEKGVG